MDLVPVFLQPFAAVADREHPVAAHLKLVVQRLHRAVVEVIFRLLALAAPQQRLMRIGEARAAKVRHRIGFAPDDIVQDPEAEILQDRADAIDVVIAADHPQTAVGLQNALALRQPGPCEIVVSQEAFEAIPLVGDGIDMAAVGPVEIAAELEIVGRIGKDEIDAGIGQLAQPLHAVTIENLSKRQGNRLFCCRFFLFARNRARLRGLQDPHTECPCPSYLSTG